MRLLNANTFTTTDFINEDTAPDYAILSHTWGDDEVTFRDLTELSREQLVSKRAWEKVEKCCTKAMDWGLEWVWIDTCCIDKSSSAELSEAINSMYPWYRKSAVCYAYLSDVDSVEEDFLSDRVIDQGHSSFDKALWFDRGWCLQELLAPRNMQFYNMRWEYIGSKHSLKERISTITHIDEDALFIPNLSVLSVAERMSWAARRKTTREEDIAYCLLGIFDINMPLLYGEGQTKAFGRLQEEIMKRTEDHSILAWSGKGTDLVDFRNDMVGFLAPHPSAFSYGKIDLRDLPKHDLAQAFPRHVIEAAPLSITGRGICAELPLIQCGPHGVDYLAVIGCQKSSSPESYYAIPVTRLKNSSDVFRRRSPDLQIVSLNEAERTPLVTIFLLRHSKPTHLEIKDTTQVWLSLFEMRDCIYKIKSAYPLSLWNGDRLAFAFSPLDREEYPRMGLAIANAKGKGFVLKIDLDPLCAHLIEINEPIFEEPDMIKKELLIHDDFHVCKSSLVLGQNTVRASIQERIVLGQDLYEVKISINAGGTRRFPRYVPSLLSST